MKPFITENDLAERYDDQPRVVEPKLPQKLGEAATVLPIVVVEVGGSGTTVGDAIVASYHALGSDVVHGAIDLAVPQHGAPFIRPHTDKTFLSPMDLFIDKEDVMTRARELYGPELWPVLMRGVPVGERKPGHGGGGFRAIGSAALAAEQAPVNRWITLLLGQFVEADRGERRGGVNFFVRRRPQKRIQLIFTCSDCGSIGSGMTLPLIHAFKQKARAMGLMIEPHLVMIGGNVYGRGRPDVVHPRIAENEDAFLVELREAEINGRISYGTEVVDIDEQLIPAGNVVLFDEAVLSADQGPATDADRLAYIIQAGLTFSMAMSSGAIRRAADLEANIGATNRVIRRMKLVGIGLDRAELGEVLARVRTARSREVLLHALRGS